MNRKIIPTDVKPRTVTSKRIKPGRRLPRTVSLRAVMRIAVPSRTGAAKRAPLTTTPSQIASSNIVSSRAVYSKTASPRTVSVETVSVETVSVETVSLKTAAALNRQTAFTRDENGSSLIECIAAILLLALISTSVSSALRTALKFQSAAKHDLFELMTITTLLSIASTPRADPFASFSLIKTDQNPEGKCEASNDDNPLIHCVTMNSQGEIGAALSVYQPTYN